MRLPAGAAVRIASTLTVLVLGAFPTAARAQVGFLVEGRVLDADTGDGVQNALVELIGAGATLTPASGVFRFETVEPRGYVLRVDAFGYAPTTRFIAVRGDVYEEIELEIEPIALDPLVVEPRTIDVDGRVRDPARDLMLVDVDVFTNQVPGAATDDHGRFSLEDVIEDAPLRVLVQAVGYLPLDTVLTPAEGQRLDLDLAPDPYAEIRIQAQVTRLEQRAAGYTTPTTPALDRERLLGWAGRTDLLGTLEYEARRYYGRVRCVVVDEQQWLTYWDASALWTFLPEELERVEFLFGGAMLRIYTRRFMGEMIARDIELRRPFIDPAPVAKPICR